ncbi:MAG TPA: hypothetical protein P5064_04800 [Clostridia bacterium]|nr:hypothetical protein [Clostridiaceae bacterium]HOF27155.1 hypothetical protein [Clostridia bacterium]HOM34837.1 hypothetical protein [Clostridia bacterium]HOR90014.1 hypothetical protein [Clostridia bacterium]HPL07959.1 hypothetical protein [Clostridia bacterium]
MDKKKKRYTAVFIVIVVMILIAAMLFIFRDSIFQKKGRFAASSFNSDIVIKRMDTQQSLNMPYRYAKILLDKKLQFADEIVGINVASVKYSMEENGISWYGYEDTFVKTDSEKDKKVVDSVKYCRGISALSAIIADKEDSKIVIYDGYSEELLLKGYQNYVIIPSSMSKYVNKEIPDSEKILMMSKSDSGSILPFTIIGEYKTEKKYDTLYVSYAGLSDLIRANQKDIPNHVDCLEIDVYEDKDITELVNYLSEYFAEGSVYSEYIGRLNVYREPYEYMFVHSLNIEPVVSLTNAIYGSNAITVSKIDGNSALEMSYVYADALIRDYDKYSQYISDIVISTGVTGINPYDYPMQPSQPGFYDCPAYSTYLQYDFDILKEIKEKYSSGKYNYLYQAVTSVSEIYKVEKDCKVTFYLNYSNKDMVVPRQKDITDIISGYAIVPFPMYEAACKLGIYNDKPVRLNESRAIYDELGNRTFEGSTLAQFKIIGYYETSDEYDRIYVTYAGSNEKYKFEQFEKEYIEAITIIPKDGMDISPLIEYLEQYFSPANDTAKHMGQLNKLDMEYKYCFTIKESVD